LGLLLAPLTALLMASGYLMSLVDRLIW